MTSNTSSWRCTVCGYIHQGTAPPDYCPICGAAESDFEAYEEPGIVSTTEDINQWQCLNCNYIHDGSSAPQECPVCGAGPDRFEGMSDSPAETTPGGNVKSVVIIGAGIAGVSAAEAVRQGAPSSKIVLLSREDSLPYYRLNLTRYLAGETQQEALAIHPQEWYEEKQIDLLIGKAVDLVCIDKKCVRLDSGEEVPFEKLILAMGSHPFVPPFPGTDLDGVITLRTTQDADRILARIKDGAKCICIGGGVLGLEIAGAVARQDAEVTLLESHQWLMPRQLNRKAGDLLGKHLTRIGIDLKKDARTQEIQGDGKVSGVLLDSGEILSANLVIIATGVRSDTYLARKAQLEVNRGIVVNNHLRSSHPDIYAAGDVAEHNGITYGTWGPSQYQGSIAGSNAAGGDIQFGGLPRSNALKILGIDLLSIGQFEPLDGSYMVCDHATDDSFYHFVFHDGRLVGAILLGDSSMGANIRKAIENKADFSAFLASSSSGADRISHLQTCLECR